jgi:radical SAM superfamily enzyme YgiQ (UPF0313 family)
MINSQKSILLINPSYATVYAGAKIKEGVPYSPVLSLATIAAPLLERGYNVRVIDLNIVREPMKDIVLLELKENLPGYVGITFTTPLYDEMYKISQWIKEFDKNIKIVGGGMHASSFPEDTLLNTPLDIVVIGEGDFTLLEILESEDISRVKGVCYKNEKGEIIRNPSREYIKDLDILPFPAWKLFGIEKYRTTDLLARKNPVGWLETSRGCIYGCVYCSKNVHGRTFRTKSAQRVLSEIEFMLKSGFQEIHIADDCFNTDMDRAKEICRLIIKKGLNFPWATVTGIRVDRVDEELLLLMRQAGCYRLYYGIESGDPEVLKNIKKGITLEQIESAVKTAKGVGLEVFGFFMIGLPGETVESMKKTIDFACRLGLDMAKMSITIPLPATPLYNEWLSKGLIKKTAWREFNLYAMSEELFDHPDLTWEQIKRYYKKFYRDFYWRPSFILNRLQQSIKRGTVFSDVKHLLQTDWS